MLASEALLLLVAWTRGVPMGQYMAESPVSSAVGGSHSANAQPFPKLLVHDRVAGLIGARLLRCGENSMVRPWVWHGQVAGRFRHMGSSGGIM